MGYTALAVLTRYFAPGQLQSINSSTSRRVEVLIVTRSAAASSKQVSRTCTLRKVRGSSYQSWQKAADLGKQVCATPLPSWRIRRRCRYVPRTIAGRSTGLAGREKARSEQTRLKALGRALIRSDQLLMSLNGVEARGA